MISGLNEKELDIANQIADLLLEKEQLQQENKQLKQENEKLQIQIANYNLFVNDILNQIHEFKEKMILGNKN